MPKNSGEREKLILNRSYFPIPHSTKVPVSEGTLCAACLLSCLLLCSSWKGLYWVLLQRITGFSWSHMFHYNPILNSRIDLLSTPNPLPTESDFDFDVYAGFY